MNIENFKEILQLRESFAKNREKARFEFETYKFDKRGQLMEVSFQFKKDLLGVEDGYHEKRHHRKMTEIKTSLQKS